MNKPNFKNMQSAIAALAAYQARNENENLYEIAATFNDGRKAIGYDVVVKDMNGFVIGRVFP